MGKKHRSWDDPYTIEDTSSHHFVHYEESEAEPEIFLDEAHEALSKLYTKANKRENGMRYARRAKQWQ